MNSEWAQWFVSMAIGAAVTWGVLTARLSALETSVVEFRQDIEQLRDDVRDIRNYLLSGKHL
jgi:hypothetical protein